MPGDRQCRWFYPQLAIHLCRRSLDSLPTDAWSDSHDRFVNLFEDTQNWVNAHPGIRWANEDGIRRPDRFLYPGNGLSGLDSCKPKTSHTRLAASVDEILLKCQVAFVRFDDCSYHL